MSPIVALRSRRSLDGLPPLASDEELIAWSRSLVGDRSDGAVDLGPTAPTSPATPRRREPLRAADRASTAIRATRRDSFITAEEIFAEIRERVTSRV